MARPGEVVAKAVDSSNEIATCRQSTGSAIRLMLEFAAASSASMTITEARRPGALARRRSIPTPGKDFVPARRSRTSGSTATTSPSTSCSAIPAKSQIEPIRAAGRRRAARAARRRAASTSTSTQKIVAARRAARRQAGARRARTSSRSPPARAASASRRRRSIWRWRWPPKARTVGMLDADIYGPSQPTMLGITGRPESTRRQDARADGSATACRRCRSAS